MRFGPSKPRGEGMKINITKKEYLTLLEILEIADWVLHAHHAEERPETGKYREFEQAIFAHAKDMGYGSLIERDPESNQYFPTRELEDTSPAMDFVREFENDAFWDELIQRLVSRDLARQVGERALQSLTLEERLEKEQPLEESYSKEFHLRGLENITLRS